MITPFTNAFIGMPTITTSSYPLVPQQHVANLKPSSRPTRAQVLGVVFPGYHEDALNDEVWGANYTEWWRVEQGVPVLGAGHDQPLVPFQKYDLSTPDALARMAGMAKANGVDSLLMYHYWFSGRRFLKGPLDTLLANPDIDTNFALCYADFELSKKQQGFEMQGVHARAESLQHGTVFQTVEHNQTDDEAHAHWLATTVFSDPRYTRVDGKPLFAYFGQEKPPRMAALRTLRSVARACCNMELYIVEFIQMPLAGGTTARVKMGRRSEEDVDALLPFSGGFQKFGNARKAAREQECRETSNAGTVAKGEQVPCTVVDYSAFIDRYTEELSLAQREAAMQASGEAPMPKSGLRFDLSEILPCSMPGWDNTPRYPHGGSSLVILENGSPKAFGDWTQRLLEGPSSNITSSATPPRFVAVNALNEWGEGCHLEPDRTSSMAYYTALRAATLATKPATAEEAKVGATAAATTAAAPSLYDIHTAHSGLRQAQNGNGWSSEIVEQGLIRQAVREGDNVLELGANIGRSTIVAAESAGPSGHIISAEADPFMREILMHNTLFSGTKSLTNVAVVPAISNTPQLYLAQDSKGGVLGEPTGSVRKATTRAVPTMPLSVVEHTPFDVLVVDCEGCFSEVLASTRDEAAFLSSVHSIVLENDDADTARQSATNARLLSHGFSPRVCVEHPFEDGDDEWHNRCFWSLFTRGSSEAEPTVVERRRATPERKGETMMEFERRAYSLTKDALAKD